MLPPGGRARVASPGAPPPPHAPTHPHTTTLREWLHVSSAHRASTEPAHIPALAGTHAVTSAARSPPRPCGSIALGQLSLCPPSRHWGPGELESIFRHRHVSPTCWGANNSKQPHYKPEHPQGKCSYPAEGQHMLPAAAPSLQPTSPPPAPALRAPAHLHSQATAGCLPCLTPTVTSPL